MDNAFNKNHPERREDEVFITNADYEFYSNFGGSSYCSIGWKTKRRGVVSYDIKGSPLGTKWLGSFPVFAKIEEIRNSKNGEEILRRLLP